MPPRLDLAAASLLALAACSSRGLASYTMAVGWRGTLPSWNGACDLATLTPAGVLEQPSPGFFVARAPGRIEVTCERGAIGMVIKVPDHLEIDGPMSPRTGETIILRARAFAGSAELDLGEAELTWSLPAQLRATDRCDHMTGSCLRSASLRVVTAQPGQAAVTAGFGPLSVTTALTIQ